jgi:hypothetical protein
VGWRHHLGLLGGGWVREIEIDSDRMVLVVMVLLALIERKKNSSARSALGLTSKFFRSHLTRFPYENFIVTGDLSFFPTKGEQS